MTDCVRSSRKVSVQCAGDVIVSVEPGHILLRCETIKKDILQRLGQNNPEPIVVNKVESEVMREIVEYCRVHWRAEADVSDLQPRIGRRQLNEYVQKFVSEKDANSLFSFIVAADHLKVSDLLDVLCEEVANRYIRGKTPEEIRYHLNIKNDWADDEDERVLQVIDSFEKGDREDKNYGMLHQLALEGDETIVSIQKLMKALLERGEDPNARESKDLTPLDMAAMMGHDHLLQDFVNLGAKINDKDKTGKTALHKAAQNGKTKCVERLIQLGTEIDILDNDGFAAIHYAAMAGSLETIVAMAKLGCNYKIRAQGPLMSGCTAAAMYCMQRREVYKESLVEGRLSRAAEEFKQSQNQSLNQNTSPRSKQSSLQNWSIESVLKELESPHDRKEEKKANNSKKKKKKRKAALKEENLKQQIKGISSSKTDTNQIHLSQNNVNEEQQDEYNDREEGESECDPDLGIKLKNIELVRVIKQQQRQNKLISGKSRDENSSLNSKLGESSSTSSCSRENGLTQQQSSQDQYELPLNQNSFEKLIGLDQQIPQSPPSQQFGESHKNISRVEEENGDPDGFQKFGAKSQVQQEKQKMGISLVGGLHDESLKSLGKQQDQKTERMAQYFKHVENQQQPSPFMAFSEAAQSQKPVTFAQATGNGIHSKVPAWSQQVRQNSMPQPSPPTHQVYPANRLSPAKSSKSIPTPFPPPPDTPVRADSMSTTAQRPIIVNDEEFPEITAHQNQSHNNKYASPNKRVSLKPISYASKLKQGLSTDENRFSTSNTSSNHNILNQDQRLVVNSNMANSSSHVNSSSAEEKRPQSIAIEQARLMQQQSDQNHFSLFSHNTKTGPNVSNVATKPKSQPQVQLQQTQQQVQQQQPQQLKLQQSTPINFVSSSSNSNLNLNSNSVQILPNSSNQLVQNIVSQSKQSGSELMLGLQNQDCNLPAGAYCRVQGETLFCCPLTHKLMKEPVIAADGHTYDLDAIWQWLMNNNTSPVSGEVLVHKKLVPNRTLKSIISSLIVTSQL